MARLLLATLAQEMSFKLMRYSQVITKAAEHEVDPFESVTEEEVISLWRSFKASGLTEDEAWHAIVTGIALDMAFARTRSLRRAEH